MNLGNLWQKHKDWIYVFMVIAIITVYTVWRLYLNPQHIPLLLTTTIIALGFVAVMALLPKYRRRLVKAILGYNTRQKELGGWLYRYQKFALALLFAIILTFPLLLQYQFIPSQFMPWAVLAFFIVILALGAIQIAGLLRAAGWWGLLLIAIITAIAVLRFLIRRLFG
ncbi:MAG: hypothetical protein ACE5FT_07190 [Candidatus Nanoarchaeia archaeon]